MRWCFFLCVLGCSSAPPPAPVAPTPVPPEVVVAPAVARKPFVGVVVARETVPVSVPVAARLAEVHVRLGQAVAEGDVLASLDTSELDADIEGAEGALREARAAVKQSRSSLAQARRAAKASNRLLARGIVAANEAEDARAEVDRAEAALSAAQARIDQRKVELGKLREVRARAELRAPLAGHVSAVPQAVGTTLAPASPIVKLIGAARDVRFAVPPDETALLTVGTEVSVVIGARRVPATLVSVAPTLDSAMQRVVAVARFAEGAELPVVGTRVAVTP